MSYVYGPGDVPLRGLTLGQLLQDAADRYGDRTGVVSVHQNIRKNFYQILRDVIFLKISSDELISEKAELVSG